MRPALEVADIVRHHGAAYRATHADRLGRSQRRVLSAIEACRTARLGGHVEQCTDCGVTRVAYNSCRNRHCPKCQGLARAQWLADRLAELLPVPYFHVVFTLPGPIAAIAFHNKAVVYDLLFKTAIDTLRTIASDPRHLGAEIGVIAVLHTWGQTLGHHPHVHCIVPGGGLSPDDTGWIACRPGFFLPVRVLARLYRRRFLECLEAAFAAGALRFGGDLAGLSNPAAFAARLRPWRRVDWVVYAKRPFGGPEQVLAYLGRYSHRVAIANSRLIGLTEG
ncbi:MAG TPA: IS91 family transposase, partial [Burkholderiales bacterium]